MLTGVKDLDYKIMNELGDKDLVNLCQTNRKADEYCKDQVFWMNRTIRKYPEVPLDILTKYKGDSTWSDYYIYQLRNINYSLKEAMLEGRLDKVIILLNKGYRPENAETTAGFAYKHVDVIKYLINHNIPVDINRALLLASRDGYISTVKYLVEHGADVHYGKEGPLYLAVISKNLDIVKYLVEHGADISIDKYRIVKVADISGFQNILDYFISLGIPDPRTTYIYG